MTPTEQAVIVGLVAAARVLWVRLGDATDAEVNQLGAMMLAAKALLEAQDGLGTTRGEKAFRPDTTTLAADPITTSD